MEPDNAHAWVNFAQTLLQTGDAKKALTAAERAVALEPESQAALAVWGLALRALDDPREQRLNDVDTLVVQFTSSRLRMGSRPWRISIAS